MKPHGKQLTGMAFCGIVTMSVILAAGSASAAIPNITSQTLITPETSAKMNKAVRGIQELMMVTISDAIRKSTSASSDPAIVRTMREQKMKERVLYGKMQPIMMEKCKTITTPLNAAKNSGIAAKKNSTLVSNEEAFLNESGNLPKS